MEHPAFEEAGQRDGIEIWTIQNFEPVAIPSDQYGKFYNGDAYIVLKTTGDRVLEYDAHFWLGEHSSQDKRGAAAILTVVLDDQLGGRARQARQLQQRESEPFLSYFKPAIRYLEGGSESGFSAVVTNAGAEKRLLKLTGCDNLRIFEVPADASSLTKTNCFILEVDHEIFVVLSPEAKVAQRRKIISIANKLRDEEHNGRATIEIIDEFSSEEDVASFFEALGSGSMDALAEGADDDQVFTRSGKVELHQVSGCADSLQLHPLPAPHKRSQLQSDEMYILDTPSCGIFVWIGAEADCELKKSYNSYAQSYIELKGYPDWVCVSCVSEGSENSSFVQHFSSWPTTAPALASAVFKSPADEGYYSGDAEESAASARQIGKTGAARGFMPDSGSGSFVVYRVSESGEPEQVFTSESEWGGSRTCVGVFFQEESYVVKYVYQDGGDDRYILYYWIGSGVNSGEKKSAASLAASMADELEGDATIVKVPQGKETKHFLALFRGNLIVLMGGHTTEFKPANSKGTYDEEGVRLFKIEGTEVGVDMRATQVAESADNLQQDGVFVLDTRAAVYVWSGQDSTNEEREAALRFVEGISSEDREIVAVAEGEEPSEFWEAIGGESCSVGESAWKSQLNRRVNVEVTLYDAIVTLAGRVRFEKICGYSQEDLSQDGAYILDTGEELYLWLGSLVPERIISRALNNARENIIEEYLSADGLERSEAVVVTVREGREPTLFKNYFTWNDDYFNSQVSYDDLKAEMKASNVK